MAGRWPPVAAGGHIAAGLLADQEVPLQPLLMHCGGSDLGGRLDALDAAMREANPGWEPLSEGARAAICASVAAAPDPSAAQRARIAHMLRGAWMRA